MIDWLNTYIANWHWIVVGLLLMTLELIVPVFVILWLGVAAVIIGILSLLLPISFGAALMMWAIISAVLLLLWHHYVSPKITNQTLAGLSKEALIGQIGMVIHYSKQQGRGRMRLPAPVVGDDEWEFIFSGTLQNGDKLQVTDISGNSLVVKPL